MGGPVIQPDDPDAQIDTDAHPYLVWPGGPGLMVPGPSGLPVPYAPDTSANTALPAGDQAPGSAVAEDEGLAP